MRYSPEFLNELKSRLRLSEVISGQVKLKRQGKEWIGLSPFSNEKTPSFFVNDEKGFYKCFSTGNSGDAIAFLQETERLSFNEAIERLAEAAGLELPKQTPEAAKADQRRQYLLELVAMAVSFYQEQLKTSEGKLARDYLRNRGLDEKAWAKHHLGYAPDAWRALADHLKAKGAKDADLIEAGLCAKSDKAKKPYDRFRGRVMFPIKDMGGRFIAFGARAIKPDDNPKYLNSSDSVLFHKSRNLYRYSDARRVIGQKEGLIICEGYMDAIALVEAGFEEVVAPLGTALTNEQLDMVWRIGGKPKLCFDGDKAGKRAAYAAIDRALPHLTPEKTLGFVFLPDGLDPDDYIKAEGAEAMGAMLDKALPLVEVIWRRELEKSDLSTPEEKAGLEERIKTITEPIQHQGLKKAYERDLRGRLYDYFRSLNNKSTSKGSGGQYKNNEGRKFRPKDGPKIVRPKGLRGLGLITKPIFHPEWLDEAYETYCEIEIENPDIRVIRDAVLDVANSDTPLDAKGVTRHLVKTGQNRAAKLIKQIINPVPVVSEDNTSQSWQRALEAFAASKELEDEVEDAKHEFAEASNLEGQKTSGDRHKRLLAEKRAIDAGASEL